MLNQKIPDKPIGAEDDLPTAYPRGAIQHVYELEKLVAQALSGNRILIFWAYPDSYKIGQFEVLGWQRESGGMLDTLGKDGKKMSLFPYLRSVAGCSGYGPRLYGEFWFTNYWHAYAHSLKGKKHD